jgi:hypothetical protein
MCVFVNMAIDPQGSREFLDRLSSYELLKEHFLAMN